MRQKTLRHILGTRRRASIRSRFEVLPNFYRIKKSLKAVAELEESVRQEVQRHFPVVSIAYFESFVRYTIAELIDNVPGCLENADKVMRKYKIRISGETLHALHGELITTGEVIAYSLGYTSKRRTFALLKKISGRDVLAGLREHHPQFAEWLRTEGRQTGERGTLGPMPWLPESWDACMASLDRTFELRHIFCHEAATGFDVSWREIEHGVLSVEYLMSLINAFLMEEIYEMKGMEASMAQAVEDATRCDHTILNIVAAARTKLPSDMVAELESITEDFRKNRDRLARWIDDLVGVGDTFPDFIYHEWQATIAMDHLRIMYWLYQYLDDEAPSGPLPGKAITIPRPRPRSEPTE